MAVIPFPTISEAERRNRIERAIRFIDGASDAKLEMVYAYESISKAVTSGQALDPAWEEAHAALRVAEIKLQVAIDAEIDRIIRSLKK